MPAKKGKKGNRTAISKRNAVLFDHLQQGLTEDEALERWENEQLRDGWEWTVDLEEPSYICTGKFEEDFVQLCKLQGVQHVPPVVPRPHRRDSGGKSLCHSRSTSLFSGRRSSLFGLRSTAPKPRKPSHATSGEHPPIPPSKTDLNQHEERHSDSMEPISAVTASSQLSFFKPCVQVEYEFSEHSKHVKEMYIRGWQVDDVMMDILRQCCPSLDYLVLMQLWNVGLKAPAVETLASFLPRCRHLNTLILDANPLIGEANLSELMSEFSPLETLSLRFCGVNDRNCRDMGTALGTMLTWNKKLLTLNLSNNQITDAGARHLADGLKTNRTLLVLNLEGNGIGDDGAVALAEVLSYFALNPEQIKYRREMLSKREILVHSVHETMSNYSSQSDLSTDSKAKRKETTTISDRRKIRSSREKDTHDKPAKAQLRSSTKSHSAHPETGGPKDQDAGAHGAKGKGKEVKHASTLQDLKKVRTKIRAVRRGSLPEMPQSWDWHPLLVPGSLDQDGQLWMLGNRSLVSLNLARNRIREEGMRRLLDMLKVQSVPVYLHSSAQPPPPPPSQQRQQQTQQQQQQQQQQPPPYSSFSGLRRLVLHKNAVTTDNCVLLQIQRLMHVRDPLYRIPLLTLHRDNVSPCAMPPVMI